MFKETLISSLIGQEIYFESEGEFPVVMHGDEPVIATRPGMWDSGYGDNYPNGIVPLNDLPFEILECLDQSLCWPMGEPTI